MDTLLLTVFAVVAILSLSFGIFCTWMAIRAAKKNKKDAEISMALWSMGSVAGFAVGAMCLAYFVIPILWHRVNS